MPEALGSIPSVSIFWKCVFSNIAPPRIFMEPQKQNQALRHPGLRMSASLLEHPFKSLSGSGEPLQEFEWVWGTLQEFEWV